MFDCESRQTSEPRRSRELFLLMSSVAVKGEEDARIQ